MSRNTRTPRTIRIGPDAYRVRYVRGRLFYKDEGDPGPRECLYIVDHRARVVTLTAHIPPELRPVVEQYAARLVHELPLPEPARRRAA